MDIHDIYKKIIEISITFLLLIFIKLIKLFLFVIF